MKRFLLTLWLLIFLSLPAAAEERFSSTGTAQISTQDKATVTVQVENGSTSFSGLTVAFEYSNDKKNWKSKSCELGTISSSSAISAAETGIWHCTVAGAKWFQARVAAISSGEVVLTLNASNSLYSSPSPQTVSSIQAGAWTTDSTVTNPVVASISNLGPSSTEEYATSTCYLITTASTNATSCKTTPGNNFGFRAINASGTIAYLRFYNLAAAPTCSSATGFIESVPISAAAGGKETIAFEI
jgi:TRAP-type C4-dicarboxylate transport system substrate-binding protein